MEDWTVVALKPPMELAHDCLHSGAGGSATDG